MSFHRFRKRPGLAICLCLWAPAALAADVYVSFDAQGVAHFAPSALDASYRLLFKDVSPSVVAPRRAAQPSEAVRTALE